MAQKRMFDKTITNSDDFLDLPDSSQVLYFHLSMNADDDGFVNNWKSILRMTGTKEDDLKILIAKAFVIPFQSGVIVIKHWRINNYLRNDRYVETKFKEEFSLLQMKENGEYSLKNDNGIPLVYPNKYSIDKNSIDKNSINIVSQNDTTNDIFDKNVEDIIAYLNFKANTRYLPSTKSTRNLIKNLFNKGFTIDDFKYVIDTKCEKWLKDKKMVEYLRPKTLFAEENFANYVGGNNKTTHEKISNSSEYDELCERGLV